MARLSFALLLVLLPSLVCGVKVPRRLRRTTEREVPMGETESRELKEALVENMDCAPLSEVSGQMNYLDNDQECMEEGGCSGGCCRVLSNLKCDTSNRMVIFQCVCNANTRQPGVYQGFTVTDASGNSIPQHWDPPAQETSQAVTVPPPANGGQQQQQVSSAFTPPDNSAGGGGGSGGGGKGKGKGKGKDNNNSGGSSSSSTSEVSSTFEATAPTDRPYVSPNGVIVTGVNVIHGSPPTPTPPAQAPSPVISNAEISPPTGSTPASTSNGANGATTSVRKGKGKGKGKDNNNSGGSSSSSTSEVSSTFEATGPTDRPYVSPNGAIVTGVSVIHGSPPAPTPVISNAEISPPTGSTPANTPASTSNGANGASVTVVSGSSRYSGGATTTAGTRTVPHVSEDVWP